MSRILLFLFLGLSTLVCFGVSPVFADELATGRALVAKSCTSCHGDEVYTRPDRKITSLAALQKRVAYCTKAAHVDWSAADKAAVVAYLNTAFYHFPTN